MAKKKRSNRVFIGATVLFLISVSVFVFKKYKQGAVLGLGNSYGYGNSYGSSGGQNKGGQSGGYSYTEDSEGNIFNVQGEPQEPTEEEVEPDITPFVTIEPVITPEITQEPEESILEEEETIEQNIEVENTNTQNGANFGTQETSANQVFVPIAEKSVVITSQQVIPVVTKSIVKRIQNKVEQIGRGEFLSKPKRTPTPTTPVALPKGNDVDQIGSDTDIFYTLTGSGVLLGATDSEGGRLNVPSEDLRSAEITMSTVLRKQGLALGINSEERFVLQEGGVRAVFDMPIYVNASNHKIRIESGGEKKEMLVTPAEAVAEAIDYGHFEKSFVGKFPEIVERSDRLVYEIAGQKTYMVFKKYPVKLSRSVYVDIETKEIDIERESFFSRFVQVLAI